LSPDLGEDNKLLFKTVYSGVGAHETLFISDIENINSGNTNIRRLTMFPEKMDLIEGGRSLLIRNALGTVKVNARGGLPQESAVFSDEVRLNESAVSPNGRWLLFLKPQTHAYGTLVLTDLLTGESFEIAENIERPEKILGASWSPDSRVIVYSQAGRLYYCIVNPNSLSSLLDERFRFIGEGTINSIVWDREDNFFYLRGSTVYKVRSTELFTRALYADFLEIGTMTGKIPFEFDPYSDEFYIAPDTQSMLLIKDRRNVFYLPLDNRDYISVRSGLPYLSLPRSCYDIKAIWSPVGGITVLASVLLNNTSTITAWRLDPYSDYPFFYQINSPSGTQTALSPDGRAILVWGENGIALYDYAAWNLLTIISYRPALSCFWTGANEIITGDAGRIERIILFPGENGRIISRELICLSQAIRFGFEDTAASRILAWNDGAWFVTDGRNPWAEIANANLRTASQVSQKYRVYLERQNSGIYENIPMIRNIVSTGTIALISGNVPGRKTDSALGLCFDLYDDTEGLPEVLDALDRRGIKATFFLGGEFIRRYPDAAKDIAEAGHETASLFFAPIDLSGSRYRIDTDFISRGLARNEDEFFNATGRELSLLWHPPWFSATPQAIIAAANSGYKTADRSVDPYDWVSRDDVSRFGLPGYTPADMIDRVMEQASPGAVIPIRLGLLPGGRENYLFRHINLLLDVIKNSGYRIVKISELIH